MRDQLINDLSGGTKEWIKMTEEEQQIMMELGEVYEDMWDIIGGGCSWYCGGGVKSITASSSLVSQGSNSYEAENAHDLSFKTAWVEGVEGDGIGEYLEYTFAPENPRITNIIVINGYVKSESAWKANSRVKKLKVYHNDQPIAVLHLKDVYAPQNFEIEPIGYSDRDDFEALQLKQEWTLKFEIIEVYKGSKYSDTVITEIYFDGIDVH